MLNCDQMNTGLRLVGTHLCSPPCELLEQVKLPTPSRTGGLLGLVEHLAGRGVVESLVSVLATGMGESTPMSETWSMMEELGAGMEVEVSSLTLVNGVIALRNFLFLREDLPVPSIFTLYWSKLRTSTI